jgi:hypothetical protein
MLIRKVIERILFFFTFFVPLIKQNFYEFNLG